MAFNFSNLIKSFTQEKSTNVLGIDIGSSYARVVELKKHNGKAVLVTYGEVALGPYAGTDMGRSTFLSSDKLAEIIKDLLRESKTTTVTSAVSIPVGASFVVFFHLPITDENQLREMVPIEARKYIPVPITEVTLDWLAIPKEENPNSEFQGGQIGEQQKGTDILLVVIHNDALTKNKEVERLAGLDVSFSEVEIFSELRVSLESGIAPQMVIDFGASSTKAFIVERGILRAAHVIGRGSQDITLSISKSLSLSFEEAEKIKKKQGISSVEASANVLEVSTITIDYILSEVSRFLVTFEKKYGKKVSKIVLSGGGAELKGLIEKCAASFETSVEIANPFSKVEYPAFLDEVLKNAGPEFSVAVGLAMRKLQEL